MKIFKYVFIIIAILLSIGIGFSGWLFYELKEPPLFTAIKNNNIEKAKKLINAGVNINQVWGINVVKTPLLLAIDIGSPELVKLLLDKGAQVETTRDYVPNPLDASLKKAVKFTILNSPSDKNKKIRQNQRKIIPLLVEAGAPMEEFIKIIPAIVMNNVDMVKQLTAETKQNLKEGRSVNITWDRNSIANAAVYSGNMKMLRYVFDNILDEPIYLNNTIKTLATETENQEIIDFVARLPQKRDA